MRIPPQTPLKRTLSRREREQLAKGFAARRARESGPDKDGVTKDIGPKMMRAAADAAEERMKQKS